MIKRTDSETKARRKSMSNKRKANRRRRLMMEGLEDRQLLNAASGTPTTPVVLPATTFAGQDPRNIGTVPAFTFVESESIGQRNLNDTVNNAEVLPLGTGLGQEDTIDVSGSMGLTFNSQNRIITDIDIYEVNLRKGDILDIALQGTAGNISVYYGEGTSEVGRLWWATDVNQAILDPVTGQVLYATGSPLQTVGNAVGAQTIPEDGTYHIVLTPFNQTETYTMGVRAYRPVLESTPIGTRQILYVDFDGGFYPTSQISGSTLPLGIVRFNGLDENLDVLGITSPQPGDLEDLQDKVMDEVRRMFQTAAEGPFNGLPGNGTNGDYVRTGVPGDYGIEIYSTHECPEFGPRDPNVCSPDLNLTSNPLVTRILVGSLVADIGIPTVGIAESVDIGNFRPDEISVVVLDDVITFSSVTLSPTKSLVDAAAKFLAGVVVHEAGHTFGERHTETTNTTANIMDSGSQLSADNFIGIGPDGIFGTADDEQSQFMRDEFAFAEQFLGYSRTAASISHNLSSGTIGTSITGQVFSDANRDGSKVNDVGLAGVTVFADVDGDGVLDPTDPSDVTGADGTYSLNVAAGAYNVIAITPDQFAPTEPSPSQQAAVGGSAGVDFGFVQVIPDITGTKFADNNGNGLFDANETGLEGFYIYIDLDGDNRPDLGEPSSITGRDGTYALNFPGPGNYTIREVTQPGFIQTFPTQADDFEHTVTFDGVALTDNYNFGNLPSRDWGDAPDSYSTVAASGGPSHGLTPTLGLGSNVDREVDGQPTVLADGDDTDVSLNDEDGVRQLTPLGPGSTATFEVTVRNTANVPGFLQGWLDFNADGDFLDAGEQVFTDLQLDGGVHSLDVSVPESVVLGTTYARFRYSTVQGLGVGGDVDDGEVEDYVYNVQDTDELLNDDSFTVSRNSQSNQFFVLANDFETPLNPLTIASVGTDGTDGTVTIAADGRSVFYTPRNNFVGLDAFLYSARNADGTPLVDENGDLITATVVVNVTFQSAVPIAVDDTFEIPQGSSNRALNVLDNDVPSISGGIRITSVTGGDQGGRVIIDGGGQTLRYTPAPGFSGTEQFTYSIEDQNGVPSFAQVTVNLLPGSRADDLVDYSFQIFDVANDREITNVQVGQQFYFRVFVDDLRYDENNRPVFGDPEGLASAFLDVLYTDELVATIDSDGDPAFPFDITFGPLFEGSGFASGNSLTPGLLDEVGAVQPIPPNGQLVSHVGPTELFTVTMEAVSPGVAVFTGDPADEAVSETILLGQNIALTPAQQRLGRTELTISPSSDNFPSAIDDSFPDGLDSDGKAITSLGGAVSRLDVLANDNLGPTGIIREFGLVTAPTLGTVVINDNNTPNNFNDDFLDYTPNIDAAGFDRFTYVIVTNDDIRSTAEVTMQVGSEALQNNIVAMDFGIVDQNGNPVVLSTDSNGNPAFPISAGERFGVQVIVEDLRTPLEGQSYVFAGYLDVLYEAGLISVSDTIDGDRYDFDVEFEPEFNADAGVGTAARLGIIDEFGTLLREASTGTNVPARNLMATLFFNAATVTQETTTRIAGGPADAFPFQDTLLFDEDDPIPVSMIRYDAINVVIRPTLSVQTNSALPEDVNDNGVVTPGDALTIINLLQRGAEGENVGAAGMYPDVNADGSATARDALQVINYLRNQVESQLFAAEGEQVAGGGADPISSDVDDVFAEISGSQKIVNAGAPAGSAAAASLIALEESSEEEEDVLSTLADDVLSQRF